MAKEPTKQDLQKQLDAANARITELEAEKRETREFMAEQVNSPEGKAKVKSLDSSIKELASMLRREEQAAQRATANVIDQMAGEIVALQVKVEAGARLQSQFNDLDAAHATTVAALDAALAASVQRGATSLDQIAALVREQGSMVHLQPAVKKVMLQIGELAGLDLKDHPAHARIG